MSLQVGDRVTWTHCGRCGSRGFNLTTRKAKIISVGNDGFVTVKFHGKIIYLRADRVRKEGERTELTDMVMEEQQHTARMAQGGEA